MTRIKLSELSELTAPDSNTSNTFVFVTDVQTGSPVSKKMSVKILDTLMDVTQGQANIAFGQANGAFVQANLAYANANAGLTTANSSFIVANAAFLAANNASKANLAFNHANAAFDTANAAFATANSANSYSAANLALTLWQTAPPATIDIAIERLANAVIILRGYSPIP